ncbi:uncharacterized protein N7458_002990 [Penicillium daleae]|uniref:Xylanolytic transcriptional activator regulatory domain-containing protein n=1 Tax=Penicillium daleae TaxID=63821 RepID=A0AAD6G7Q0_9EURO|nr:uncharacterized protein N7458_002990 [Penicillium daleae]KAJ5461438.1 hypothetical protein N7458_002990 [Penicillium daleae]
MEPGGSDREEHETPGALTRRAIRCDKRVPCSNCHSSNITCRSTGEGQRPSEPRRRVLISSQYEKKIDLIEERLGGVEETLQRLGGIEQALRELLISSRQQGVSSTTKFSASSLSSPDTLARTQSSASKQDNSDLKAPGYTSNLAIEQHDSGSTFEGNSSLAAHSAYAQEFLETAVSHSTPEMFSSPKISEALSSLKQIVEMQSKQRDAGTQRGQLSSRLGARCDIRELEMPPLPVVLTVLKRAKENPPASFGGYIPFFTVDYFISRCQEVYFATEEYSDATFIIANFGLYGIFVEYGFCEKEPVSRDEYQKYVQVCKDNLETALANLNILMPVNMDSVVALAVGAIHGIEISKPSVSWTLASTAIHMCQTLGYNRLSSMEHDPLELQHRKQDIFWSVYTIMNLMSLRLGRASVVQACDVDIPSPFECFPNMGVWSMVCSLWARQAVIQNDIYTNLYSPAALNQPESERAMHARRLAVEMKRDVLEPFDRILTADLNMSEVDVIYLRSDGVSRLAILTLIYRAIPVEPGSPSTFIPECIETARASLELHQVCIASLKEASENLRCSYMHWAIFLSPFVPFIVIFCHVITTSDSQDLTRLEDFVASLRPLCRFSQSIDRLHNLCSVLGTVARLYVEAKSRKQAGEDQNMASVGQEFDAYLSALGLAPGNAVANNPWGAFQPDGSSMNTGVPDASLQTSEFGGPSVSAPGQTQGQDMSMAEMSQAAQLGNWFSGNQYMMGLLEEDMFQFNPT